MLALFRKVLRGASLSGAGKDVFEIFFFNAMTSFASLCNIGSIVFEEGVLKFSGIKKLTLALLGYFLILQTRIK